MEQVKLTTPLTDEVVEKLHIGQKVLLNGVLYTARDAAHREMIRLVEQGKDLPIDVRGQVIYYTGPTPARPGRVIGSAGPTTSGRMDVYTPRLIALGLKGMVGKGKRSPEVIEAMKRYKAVYFAAVGGAAAYLSRFIKKCRVIAYPDLGPEAVYELTVEDFPVIVVNDVSGNDLYEEGRKLYVLRENLP